MKNKNPFGEIRNAYEYALKNHIDPKKPETWDENYSKRIIKLSGIIPILEEEIISLKELIK